MMPAALAIARRIEPSASVRPAPWLRSSARKATSAYWPVTIRQPQTVSMSRLRLRPTCGNGFSGCGGGGVPRSRSSGTAVSAVTHAAAARAHRQLDRCAIQGRVAAATRPATGMPVCRMPRAVPRRFFGKASRTRRPPAGVELAPVAPASTSRGTKTGKGATAATSTIPAVASPPTNSVRCSPSRSADTPAAYAPMILPSANEATIRPARKAERSRSCLMYPVSVRTPWSIRDTPNCIPTARPRIVHGERSAWRLSAIVPSRRTESPRMHPRPAVCEGEPVPRGSHPLGGFRRPFRRLRRAA